METFLAAIGGIILVNLILSGDNVVVIGLAVRALPPRQRQLAVLLGGLGALALRVVLTALVAFIILIPLLQAVGGLVLVWITYRLLAEEGNGQEPDPTVVKRSFWAAMQTIIIADITMSTDNVLAVGAVARGDALLLLIGLGISMAIIMVGGTLVAELLTRLPWLTYIGGGILLILAGDLVAHDALLAPWLRDWPWAGWALTLFFALVVGWLLLAHRQRATTRATDLQSPDRA